MTYSYTQISHYLACPRRYRHRYLDGKRRRTREQPCCSVVPSNWLQRPISGAQTLMMSKIMHNRHNLHNLFHWRILQTVTVSTLGQGRQHIVTEAKPVRTQLQGFV